MYCTQVWAWVFGCIAFKNFTLKFCKCSCRFLKFCEILEVGNNNNNDDDFIFLLSVGIKTFYNFLFIHIQSKKNVMFSAIVYYRLIDACLK